MNPQSAICNPACRQAGPQSAPKVPVRFLMKLSVLLLAWVAIVAVGWLAVIIKTSWPDTETTA